MATNEEELSVILSLKDAFSQQITKPLQRMETLNALFNKLSSSVKLAGGIISGALALTARSIMNTADELVKMNTITGFSIERLQKLGLAAELNSSSMGELSIGLRQLSRQALGAADGTGEAAELFKRLGVTVTDSSGNLRQMEAIFDDTVNALSKVKNSTEQAALAQQMFGRSGQNLIPLIKEGTEGFDRIGKIAEEMGIVIKEDTVKALEVFGDQMTLLKEAGKGLVAEGLLGIAKALPDIIDGFFIFAEVVHDVKRQLQDFTAVVGSLADSAKSFLAKQITSAETLIKLMPEVWEQFKQDPKNTAAQFFEGFKKGLAETSADINKAAIDANNAINKNQEAFNLTKKDLEEIRLRLQNGIKAMEGNKKATEELADATGGTKETSFSSALDKLFEAQKRSKVEMDAHGDQMRQLEQNVKDAKDAYEAYIKEAAKNGEISDDEKRNLYTLSQALDHATTARDRHKDAIEQERKAKEDADRAWGEAQEAARENGFQVTDEQLQNIIQHARDAGISIQEMFAKMREGIDQQPLNALEFALKTIAEEVIDLKGAFLGFFRSMEGAFSNAFEAMMTGGAKFKNIMKGIFNDIKRSFIKMISDILAQQIMKQFASMFFGGGGGGAGGAMMMAGGGGGGGSTAGAASLAGGSGAALGSLAISGVGAVGGASSLGAIGGGITMAGLGVGVAVGTQGIEEGNVGASVGGMALTGAALGTMIAPGIGTAIGAVLGAAYGAWAGSREKKKQEKAKEKAAAQAAEQQRILDEQRQKAADLLEKEMIGRYGGGLADPDQAAAIGQIFSGDVTPEDLDQLGIKPQDVLAREGEINNLTNVATGPINVSLNVAGINSAYDVRQVAQDLGYHLQQALQDAAASNP